MYTKGTTESVGHINIVNMRSKSEAEAYFAGVKRLTLEQFRNLFDVREVKEDSKNLLLG
tara:strand:+ start:291 stop:467 length:177 start_codon:yes stop_codon:yes gene_type:complete